MPPASSSQGEQGEGTVQLEFQIEEGCQAQRQQCRLDPGRPPLLKDPQGHHHGFQEDRRRQDRTLQAMVHQEGNRLVA
jgi:hypothetical protein